MFTEYQDVAVDQNTSFCLLTDSVFVALAVVLSVVFVLRRNRKGRL